MQSIEGGHAWYRQGLASSYIAILIKVKRGEFLFTYEILYYVCSNKKGDNNFHIIEG
ncbi:hypothetical protein IX335_000965 [Porphyromonas levii]|nr:hypothetical protein [Porphyromonas levii]MBR8763750.1 hypothetical protein [Porphyromonas levii]